MQFNRRRLECIKQIRARLTDVQSKGRRDA